MVNVANIGSFNVLATVQLGLPTGYTPITVPALAPASTLAPVTAPAFAYAADYGAIPLGPPVAPKLSLFAGAAQTGGVYADPLGRTDLSADIIACQQQITAENKPFQPVVVIRNFAEFEKARDVLDFNQGRLVFMIVRLPDGSLELRICPVPSDEGTDCDAMILKGEKVFASGMFQQRRDGVIDLFSTYYTSYLTLQTRVETEKGKHEIDPEGNIFVALKFINELFANKAVIIHEFEGAD